MSSPSRNPRLTPNSRPDLNNIISLMKSLVDRLHLLSIKVETLSSENKILRERLEAVELSVDSHSQALRRHHIVNLDGSPVPLLSVESESILSSLLEELPSHLPSPVSVVFSNNPNNIFILDEE
jgi:hypothetical protein